MAGHDNLQALIGRTLTVRKLSAAGAMVFAYPGVVGAAFATGVRIDAEWTRARMDLGYTMFETGDRFTEWFYTDRWYNIMEVRTMDGALKGWYCNITRPATIGDDAVSYVDLALDLWVGPDGASLLLDEDEFANDPHITEESRVGARIGLAALHTHLAQHETPFDALVGS